MLHNEVHTVQAGGSITASLLAASDPSARPKQLRLTSQRMFPSSPRATDDGDPAQPVTAVQAEALPAAPTSQSDLPAAAATAEHADASAIGLLFGNSKPHVGAPTAQSDAELPVDYAAPQQQNDRLQQLGQLVSGSTSSLAFEVLPHVQQTQPDLHALPELSDVDLDSTSTAADTQLPDAARPLNSSSRYSSDSSMTDEIIVADGRVAVPMASRQSSSSENSLHQQLPAPEAPIPASISGSSTSSETSVIVADNLHTTADPLQDMGTDNDHSGPSVIAQSVTAEDASLVTAKDHNTLRAADAAQLVTADKPAVTVDPSPDKQQSSAVDNVGITVEPSSAPVRITAKQSRKRAMQSAFSRASQLRQGDSAAPVAPHALLVHVEEPAGEGKGGKACTIGHACTAVRCVAVVCKAFVCAADAGMAQ